MTDKVASFTAKDDHLGALKALRDRLARDIDNELTSPRDRATLSRQIIDVLAEIERLAPAKTGTPLDDLAVRRAERKSSGAHNVSTEEPSNS